MIDIAWNNWSNAEMCLISSKPTFHTWKTSGTEISHNCIIVINFSILFSVFSMWISLDFLPSTSDGLWPSFSWKISRLQWIKETNEVSNTALWKFTLLFLIDIFCCYSTTLKKEITAPPIEFLSELINGQAAILSKEVELLFND